LVFQRGKAMWFREMLQNFKERKLEAEAEKDTMKNEEMIY